jgi:hypothetical protein
MVYSRSSGIGSGRLRGAAVGEGCSDRRSDRFWLVEELPVREPQRAVAGPGEKRVSRAVVLEGVAGAVVGPAVGLDDEFRVLEEEVDLPELDPRVDERGWQAAVAAQREEALFESRLRRGGAGVVGLQSCPQSARSAVAGVGSGEGIEGGIVGQLADLRLVERPLERAALQDGGEVEERAGGAS